ncbi:hypothetical protein JI721_04520 [Alicyclobacillus cycloheptanicus]|uniref:Uncharacterized protein n=1 Tax=Alicyclobacillus cycloheptanicus TaxID=1457 RepID=A0ABT9XII6_9BACL|nr:hypothetical protein [Alicyclobacillus cycloheptanicus]MDQ0190122.1 hypothetical protein [Alicyclobacillus cycloheptanicus]WDM02094.1 hypothetical protein JI721_04520 [Alicyclobacillus cycloheptanicus]
MNGLRVVNMAYSLWSEIEAIVAALNEQQPAQGTGDRPTVPRQNVVPFRDVSRSRSEPSMTQRLHKLIGSLDAEREGTGTPPSQAAAEQLSLAARMTAAASTAARDTAVVEPVEAREEPSGKPFPDLNARSDDDGFSSGRTIVHGFLAPTKDEPIEAKPVKAQHIEAQRVQGPSAVQAQPVKQQPVKQQPATETPPVPPVSVRVPSRRVPIAPRTATAPTTPSTPETAGPSEARQTSGMPEQLRKLLAGERMNPASDHAASEADRTEAAAPAAERAPELADTVRSRRLRVVRGVTVIRSFPRMGRARPTTPAGGLPAVEARVPSDATASLADALQACASFQSVAARISAAGTLSVPDEHTVPAEPSGVSSMLPPEPGALQPNPAPQPDPRQETAPAAEAAPVAEAVAPVYQRTDEVLLGRPLPERDPAEIERIKHRYIVGKRSGKDILDRQGDLLIGKGEVITETAIQLAEQEGKLVELIVNMVVEGCGD